MKLPIYLDYMATTPMDPRVAEKMAECLTQEGVFGNSASGSHAYGWQAAAAVTNARQQVAELINAKAREIVWTSGATEANNLAIKGAAQFYQRKGKHIVTCTTEHKAVLDTCQFLESQGFDVTYLVPTSNGLLDLTQLEQALRDDTILVSIMQGNNEIGVVQDIAAIGQLTRARGILLHVDAAQGAGKLPIDVQAWQVDLMSFSAHKIYGPKGIGALYVRHKPRVRLQAQIHGGGHENGMRSGTLPTHQIVGMGEAFAIAKAEMNEDSKCILQLRQRLLEKMNVLPAIQVNGDLEQRVPGNLNVSFVGIDGESLHLALKDLALSAGSACTSASIEPSYVLKAIGLSDELAHSALRISIGRFTTAEEIDFAAEQIVQSVKRLREMSPLWNE